MSVPGSSDTGRSKSLGSDASVARGTAAPSRRSIRVTLTIEQAEALLEPEHADPRVRLKARAKLITPLLADLSYEPPSHRRAREAT